MTRLWIHIAALLLLAMAGAHAQESAPGDDAQAGPTAQAPATDEPEPPPKNARLSIFVFSGGVPQPGIEVLDDELIGETDSRGALFFELAPGEHELTIRSAEALIATLPLNLIPDESAQLLVTIFDDGRDASIVLDSSNQGQGLEASGEAEQLIVAGDPGKLSGKVFSVETGEGVSGARIFISGTPVDLQTSPDGLFEVDLPPGTYSISVMHGEHATLTQDGIEIVSEQTTPLEVELVPAGLELPEFVVLEPFVEGSLASVIEERRTSAAVTDILGAEQISRAGDSDAAGALRRVTGLTLVDGSFIYIRGMGERYSTTLINGAQVPSPDATRRVVPLNLFPTSIIGSVAVQKSFSAQVPGEFGGGTVDIRTRGIPESRFFKVGFSLGGDAQATGEAFLTYDGGGSDWTGFDNGRRDIPTSLSEAIADQRLCVRSTFAPDCSSPEDIELFGEELAGEFTPEEEDGPINLGLDISYGDRFDYGKWTLGFLGAVNYDQGWDTNNEQRNQFTASDGPDGEIVLDPIRQFNVRRSLRDIALSSFVTAEASYTEAHRVQYTGLFVRTSQDETRVDLGIDNNFDGLIQRVLLEWIENDLLMHQLTGANLLPLANIKLDWQITDARARRSSPNTRSYRYNENRDGEFELNPFGNEPNIEFADLIDDSRVYRVGATLPFDFSSNVVGQFAAGYETIDRDRDSSIRRFTYRLFPAARREIIRTDPLELILGDDNVRPSFIELQDNTQVTDFYTAIQKQDAYYLEADSTFWNTLRVTLGMRQEKNLQEVITDSPFENVQPDVATLDTDDRLPAAALTWFINDSHQLRVSFAETVARPDFRELTESPFVDPVTDAITVGNSGLVPTDIEHRDIRWEYYPSSSESISVAYFEKEFLNPIEIVLEPGETRRQRLQNALGAENRGIEVEGRKELAGLTSWRWLDRITVAANFSIIESEISLDPEQALSVTNTNRALQGQSEYIVNVQVEYTDEQRGIESALVFNTYGERIATAGLVGNPDVFEQPFNQLDLIVKKTFEPGLEMEFKVRNILDESIQFTVGDEVFREFKKGVGASLSLKYSFF
ncbi:MAG: TonB-dependent receptor [Pseudomonadota bacterium]